MKSSESDGSVPIQGSPRYALVDPTWVATTSMAFARPYPASSLVIDSKHVLVTGGYDAIAV